MKRAPAGTRDRLVTIQGIAEAANASGFPVKALTGTAYQMWAAKREASAYERFAGDQVTARADHEWEIAYRVELDPERVDVAAGFQLVYMDRTHDITGVEMVGRRAGIRLKTMARVG